MSETKMVYPLVADSWGPEEYAALQRVIRTGKFSKGKEVEAFEREFAAKIGSRYAVMTNSGSSANWLAAAALTFADGGLCDGDEVIVPAIGWSTSYSAFFYCGKRIHLKIVDVDLETLNIDMSCLEQAIGPKTKAIVAINILGNPCDLLALKRLCYKYNLWLFEDNCESLGAEIGIIQCGARGDVGTFSFFFSHHISTMEGGMLVTDRSDIADYALMVRAHGWTRDVPKDSPVYRRPNDWRYELYDFQIPGLNCRPLEMCGAVGRQQLKKLDVFIEQRRKNGFIFTKLFEGDERFIIQRETGKSSWFNFSVILNPAYDIDRERVWNGLNEAGIEFRPITGGNFAQHGAAQHYDYETVGELPNATLAHDNGFFVGNSGNDMMEQITYFHEALTKLV